MPEVDTDRLLAIVGVIVGIVGLIATIAAARRWGTRRHRLLYEWGETSLLPERGNLLKVTFRDLPVDDPYLVTIVLRNIGPGDISSQIFDGGKPLVINLGCKKWYGITRNSHPHATLSNAVGSDDAVVQLRPTLLRTGEEVAFEAVVEGKSKPELESPLIDTDIVDGPAFQEIVTKQLIWGAESVALSLPGSVLVGGVARSVYRTVGKR